MPSTTEKQAQFMSACSHGWDSPACPPKNVADKFHEADKKEGKFICKTGCDAATEEDMGDVKFDLSQTPAPAPGDLVEFMSDQQAEPGPCTGTVGEVEGDDVYVMIGGEAHLLNWPDVGVRERTTSKDGKPLWVLDGAVPERLGQTMDDATTLSPIARLRLIKELKTLRTDLGNLGAGAMDNLKRLKMLARIKQIRVELGGGSMPRSEPIPPPPEPATPGAEHLATLRAIADGNRDTEDLGTLLDAIAIAVNALNDAGLLADDADQAANDAMTHWVLLDEKANG